MIALIALLGNLNMSSAENADFQNYRVDYFVYFNGMNADIFQKNIAGGFGSVINFGNESNLYGIGAELGTTNLNHEDKNRHTTLGGILKYSYIRRGFCPTGGFVFNFIDVSNKQFKYSGYFYLGVDMVNTPKQSKIGKIIGLDILLNPGPQNPGIGAQLNLGFSFL